MNVKKIGMISAVALLFLILTTVTASAATTVTISSAEVGVSESTTVPIMINNVPAVKGAHILLEYDSSVVHALDIGNSDFALETFKEIDNGTGYVRYAVFGLTALNGDVKFADVTLEGMNAGSSPLNLTVESLSDGTSEILRDVVNGTFTVVLDNPPWPNITNPQDGATLSGTIAIEEIDESGEEDIAYNLFEYYYDENCNGEEDDGNEWVEIGNDTAGGDGWSVNWDTAALTDGCYKIRATMGDEEGQTGQDEINVMLSNHDPVPTITAPLDGATLTDLVTIVEEDTGFDAGADIVYNLFEYYYDENCNGEEDDGNEWVEIGNDTAGGDGWSVNWDTAALTDGCYKIRVTMGDEQGRTGQDEINVTIDNTPPVATDPSASPLIIPEDTDSDPRWGETSNLSVTVTDESVIASVTIDLSSIGGSAVQPMTNTGGDVWTVSTAAAIGTAVWNGTAYEPHYLQVNATDITGKSNTSASVELLVMKNGDVDENGGVNLDDAVYLANYALLVPGYDLVPGVADVDGSGAANLDDAVYLANHALLVPGYETLY
jgi:hypothetical protein